MGLFGKWSRRDLLKSSGAVAGAMAPVVAATPAMAQAMPAHSGTDSDNLFTRIGVRPLINGRGTYTIISGSMEEDLQKFRAITRAERYLSRRIISLED